MKYSNYYLQRKHEIVNLPRLLRRLMNTNIEIAHITQMKPIPPTEPKASTFIPPPRIAEPTSRSI